MISLYTNKTEYIADIADELRLFLAKRRRRMPRRTFALRLRAAVLSAMPAHG